MGDPTCSAFDIRVEFSVCIAQILYICDNEQQSGGFWSSDYAGGTAEFVRVTGSILHLYILWLYVAIIS